MSHLSSNHEQYISEQAAKWLVLLDDDASDETRLKFNQWKAQDPRHQAAIDRLQQLIGDIESIKAHSIDDITSRQIIQQTIQQQHRTRHYLKKSILSLAALGSTCILTALFYAPMNYWIADQRNSSQSWQRYTLDDQSQIQLSGKTAYNIHYTTQYRKIELLQGNILVDVAKDKTRPFRVETQHGTVQALGTRFMVTQNAEKTTLTMLESKTAVWSRQSPHPVYVIAGQRIELNEDGLMTSKPIHINAELFEKAWQQRKIVANGDNLVDILDYLTLFYPGKIHFDRHTLSNIQVTATLPLDNIELALQQLANELQLDIKHPMPYMIQIKKIDLKQH